MRRYGRTGTIRRHTEPFDFFHDAGLAERFVADLGELRSGLGPTKQTPPAAAGAGTGAHSTAAHVDHGNWEDYLDDCAGRIGNPLVRFALGLPSLPAGDPGSWRDIVNAAWDEELPDEDERGLDIDDADDIAQSAYVVIDDGLPSLSDLPAHVRNRYRTWAARLADMAAGLGPTERLAALRLILWIAASWPPKGRTWPAGQTELLAIMGKATEALGQPPEPPIQAEPNTASLAAVAVSILRAQAPRTENLEQNRIFKRASTAVSHLLPYAELRYIGEYTRLLGATFGQAVDPTAVATVAKEIVQADPLGEALLGLEEHDIWNAHVDGQLLHLPNHYNNPLLPALRAVGLAEEAGVVGAWAGTPTNWALVIWRKPDLAVFTHRQADRWFYYRLTGTYTPRTCAYGDREIDPRFRVAESFSNSPYPETLNELLAAVDLHAPAPPDCS